MAERGEAKSIRMSNALHLRKVSEENRFGKAAAGKNMSKLTERGEVHPNH